MNYFVSIGLFLLALLGYSQAYAESTFTPAQQQQIQTITHDYLLQNPQVIIEAVQKLQEQAHDQMVQQAQQIINSQATKLFYASNSPVIGNTKSNITLVEFFDYQCPYCKRIAPAINQLLQENKNLRIVYKELPIFGDSSFFAAQAALAAQMQNKYLRFHDALMAAKPPFTREQILTLATSVGLNSDKLQTDMKSPAVIAEIKNNVALANQMQLAGTPAFIIANVTMTNNVAKPSKSLLIPGAVTLDNLQDAIKQVQ